MFDKDPLTALEAISAAQALAFGPLAFQATIVMRDRGVLSALAEVGPRLGCSISEIANTTGLSVYAVRVLLEAGLGQKIVWRNDERYFLGKLGYFLLNDEMTRVNFDFTRDVCYQAAAHLDESLVKGKPSGLRELGPWETLYEGLSILSEPALGSWHKFDHFYSNQAFEIVIKKIMSEQPSSLLDVGCNTGKWAELCLEKMPELDVGLVDLPIQLNHAKDRLELAGFGDRIALYPQDLLKSDATLPEGYEIIWMSQFLDCFSEQEIVSILTKVRDSLRTGGKLWILELFWDRQRFEAAAFSLQQTSLYFSCVANGNSQMYDSKVFLQLIKNAGLKVTNLTDEVGGYHTLIECCVSENNIE